MLQNYGIHGKVKWYRRLEKTFSVSYQIKCASAQFSRSVVSDSLRPHGHSRFPCPLLSPRACSNSCPSSWWCYPTISSSVVPFSSCLQSFPASGSSLVSQFFASGGQSIGASASVLPVNIQGWFSLGLTALISLQSQGLSRVFSNTTVPPPGDLPDPGSKPASPVLAGRFFTINSTVNL